MDNGTYIKLFRKILNHEVFGDETAFRVFLWILLSANYETGELISGRFWASQALKMNPNTYYKTIQKLEKKYELVTLKSNNKNTVILLNNWKSYQQSDNNKVTTKEQQSNNKVTLNKNIRNKEIKNIYTKTDELDELVLKEISEKYSVPLSAVLRKKDQLHMWLEEETSRYKIKGKLRNLKLTLMNWVRRDIDKGDIKIQKTYKLPETPEISDEQRKLNIAQIAEIKSKFKGVSV